MRRLRALLALSVCVCLAGCAEKTPPAETLPSVTLLSRRATGSTITLAFCVTHLDRVDWTGRTLKIQLVKSAEEAKPGMGEMIDPGAEVTVEVGVGKVVHSDGVFFVPRWGRSRNVIMSEGENLELAGPGGSPNRVVVPDTTGRRITQILQTCVGPRRTMPFDPAKGVHLVTVGFGDDACHLKLWVAPASAGGE